MDKKYISVTRASDSFVLKIKEPLIYSGRSRLWSKISRFKARIARNSGLLRRFGTQKQDILDARYEFMNKSEAPRSIAWLFCVLVGLQACTSPMPGDVPIEDRSTQADQRLSAARMSADSGSRDRTAKGDGKTYSGYSEPDSDSVTVYPRKSYSRSTFTQSAGGTQIREEPALQLEKEYKEGSAIASLLKEAEIKIKEGRLNLASSLLERALRIEPKNALVWHKLAGVRFKQKRWKLAESLARKSYLFSSDDLSLQIYNWHLIASARSKQGDIQGAREAKARAEQIAASKH